MRAATAWEYTYVEPDPWSEADMGYFAIVQTVGGSQLNVESLHTNENIAAIHLLVELLNVTPAHQIEPLLGKAKQMGALLV